MNQYEEEREKDEEAEEKVPMHICLEIAAAESIPGLGYEAPKAN